MLMPDRATLTQRQREAEKKLQAWLRKELQRVLDAERVKENSAPKAA